MFLFVQYNGTGLVFEGPCSKNTKKLQGKEGCGMTESNGVGAVRSLGMNGGKGRRLFFHSLGNRRIFFVQHDS